jgi:hypothetical protein
VQFASVAFSPFGEVLVVVFTDGTLTQFDSLGAHRLGNGVQFATAAYGPSGEVLEVVYTGGGLTQFDSSGAHVLLSSGVQFASVAFGPTGEVLEVVHSEVSPPEAVSALISQVRELVNLNSGEQNELAVSLQNALASILKGNATAAANQLTAFINKVDALQKSERLPAKTTAILMASAQMIINAIHK